MRWSFRVLTIAGIRIEVHATFLLMVAGLALVSSAKVPWWITVGELLLVFGCVLLHELGHALAARRYGIATRSILLLPFGGLARLERMPEKPSQEIVVALAGPGVNVLLAILSAVALAVMGVPPERLVAQGGAFLSGTSAPEVATVVRDLLEGLFALNIALLCFNLIPAFPMDEIGRAHV